MPKPTLLTYERMSEVFDDHAAAPYGSQNEVIARHAARLGCSPGTLRDNLKSLGFPCKPRKQRSDAKESVMSDQEILTLAGVLRASLNKKGQRMPLRTALDMLLASGQLKRDVHESTASRQLSARQLHPNQMALPEPSLVMRSLHPNHVWQVDSTTGAYYYLPGGRLRWMPEDQFYKNKVANIVKASSDLLTRYAVADHYSHAMKFRYYLGGESRENLFDFLTWAMWKQSGPMHGVPLMLVTDQGPANKSHQMRNFCKRLGMKLGHHAPGAARVTGSVEKAHDIARMHFETRFRFREPSEVTRDKLNEDIQLWADYYCAHNVHGRHQQTRYGAWMCITPDQLRVPASFEALQEATTGEPEERLVNNSRRISFGSPSRKYLLDLVPGVAVGMKVKVQANPFRAPAIDVLFTCPDTGEETWHVVEPEAVDAAGFPMDAPVWGEQMRRAGFSDVDRNRNALTKEAYKTGDGLPTLKEAEAARKAHQPAYAGLVDSMADVRSTAVPTYLPRQATPLELPTRKVESKRLTVVEACQRIKDQLGQRYKPQIYADVSARYGDPANPGVPEEDVPSLVEHFGRDNGGEGVMLAAQGFK